MANIVGLTYNEIKSLQVLVIRNEERLSRLMENEKAKGIKKLYIDELKSMKALYKKLHFTF